MQKLKPLALLPCEDKDFNFEIFGSPAQPIEKFPLRCEQAGRAFHAFHRAACGLSWVHEDSSKKITKTIVIEEEEEIDFGPTDEMGAQKSHYALLGIGHLGLNASEEQISKAYKVMLVKTHPDKIYKNNQTPQEKEAANLYFRQVQNAYEVLSKEESRRGYDSQFDFDDFIPAGFESLKDDAAFFSLYGPVFESNARFSMTKPVPLLGSNQDNEETVKQMYLFWQKFKSWRDFSAFDEFKDGDLETAEGRDHRRDMIKKNLAQQEKRKRLETTRVRNLVERAMKNDPRLRRFKEAAEKAKLELIETRNRLKNAGAEQKKKEEEEREALRLAEEKIAQEKNRDAKKERENLKKKTKQALKAVQASVEACGGVDELTLQRGLVTLGVLSPQELLDLANKIKSKEVFLEFCNEVQNRKETSVLDEAAIQKVKLEEQQAALSKLKIEKKVVVWTPEALSYLAKGMAKYPGGTRERWTMISNYVHTCNGFEASPDECIAQSNKLTHSMGAATI